jgi:hypothetical protein
MVSTPPVPPDGPDDLDPTGIRALLSALPDPGPMPPDLVERINASIAAEQAARETATVVPLRPRRWGWQHLGAAAAAAAVFVVGGSALVTGTGPGDVLASLSGGSSADGDSAGSVGVESRAAAGAAPVSPQKGSSITSGSSGDRVRGPGGEVVLVASGAAYTSAGLATQARSTIDAAQGAKDTEGAPMPHRAAGVADTGTGLRACLTAVGVQPWMPVRADSATLDGAPAVIAVVSSDTDQIVYAVSPACDAAHPTVLAGPLQLP